MKKKYREVRAIIKRDIRIENKILNKCIEITMLKYIIVGFIIRGQKDKIKY